MPISAPTPFGCVDAPFTSPFTSKETHCIQSYLPLLSRAVLELALNPYPSSTLEVALKPT